MKNVVDQRYSVGIQLRATREGGSGDPSGWVGDCPFGECRRRVGCHSVMVSAISTGGHVNRSEEPENSSAAETLVDEVLVEEVSIDGMCGVY